ncbi:MAG: SRPBCC domain-containing protein [Candidatus Hydrogenedentota bacterium]
MSVKKEASGRKSVQVHVEVPGTPEEVWRAIATGPGISSWFAPSKVEERAGGAVDHHFGGGMESHGTVTVWEPPLRFSYEEREWAPGAPPLGTEIVVESRAGGACVVRLVQSLFASGDEWDEQMEGFESGWPPFFDVLRLYLSHFRGQPCSPIRLMGQVPGPLSAAWDNVRNSLGLMDATKGQHRDSGGTGAPRLAGTVERTGPEKHPTELLLRLDEPSAGLALVGVWDFGGQMFVLFSLYWYGERAANAAKDKPKWESWLNKLSSAG